ncbi:MAG: VTT domain-containing protein [Candidatus Hodarchaeota archaeon]
MRTLDRIFIVALVLVLAYYITSIISPQVISPLVILYEWILDVSLAMGYLGAIVVSFLGNATVLFPFPYVGVPFILGGLADEVTSNFIFDPWTIGVLAGVGATLGEMTGYFIGYFGGTLIAEEHTNSFRSYALKHPRMTPVMLWFLAATPIPDDVLIVPLGAAKYSWWKVFLPQLIGKIMFLTGIAWSGRLGLTIINDLLGSLDPTSIVSRTVEFFAAVLLIAALYLLIRIDWNKKRNETKEEA